MTETENNNVNETADELLEELQELEASTESMEQSVEEAAKKQEELSSQSSPDAIDAAALSLEAAKTSQQAASQIQNAAEAVIKLSYEQKKQVMELSDSNLSWRQTLRSANKELESSKNTLTIMLVVGIVVSLISTGIMGFLFYSMNKKSELLKGDVLDIISTEITLFNKQMTLKIDQMGALIEGMAADIQRLPVTTASMPMAQNNATEMMARPQPAPQPMMPKDKVEPINPEVSPQHNGPDHAMDQPAKSKPEVREVVHKEIIENKVVVDDEAIKAQVQKFAASQQQQLEKIERLIAQLMDKQSQMPVPTNSAMPKAAPQPQTKVSKVVTAPVEVTSMGLTESQVKKLNNISWAVHKQGKMLKEIQALLKAKKPVAKKSTKPDPLKGIQTSLNDLHKQMKALKDHQMHIQKEVEALKAETKKLAAKPDPYSYRAKELQGQ